MQIETTIAPAAAATSPDFAALRTRQQAAWSAGDYAVVGTTLQIVGESLAEAMDLRAGSRVLDVAAGNGNATLAAARRYNALARANGLTPTQMALAWCYTKWQVASTIIGVTTVAQLEEDLGVWGTKLPAELLAQIDQIRWEIRDPAV